MLNFYNFNEDTNEDTKMYLLGMHKGENIGCVDCRYIFEDDGIFEDNTGKFALNTEYLTFLKIFEMLF